MPGTKQVAMAYNQFIGMIFLLFHLLMRIGNSDFEGIQYVVYQPWIQRQSQGHFMVSLDTNEV
jgi:hypothetical protein